MKLLLVSLDWATNNEKLNFQKVRPGDEVLKGSTVFSSDQAHLNEENKIP